MFTLATEAVSATLRDSKAVYILETDKESSIETPQPVILRGIELDLQADVSNTRLQDGTPQVSGAKQLSCAYFCLKDKDRSSFASVEVNFMSIAFLSPPPSSKVKVFYSLLSIISVLVQPAQLLV